ncbi:unnamed protein product [Nippostrongylus brasiliensis]|uniref:DUF433 domain-containing protein n=1 Tax=Nippostrongylus brasiliensis TaxID=27835 RepID=A0A0N4YCS1_NIPBR|nr:unnamed protein product [Nippostrongylus brasiliensis]
MSRRGGVCRQLPSGYGRGRVAKLPPKVIKSVGLVPPGAPVVILQTKVVHGAFSEMLSFFHEISDELRCLSECG